jgi:hypothetical protein
MVRIELSPLTYPLSPALRRPWREEQPLAVTSRTAAAATVESTRPAGRERFQRRRDTAYLGFFVSGAPPAE